MGLLLKDDASPALRAAVTACREHFWLAAGLSALVNILYLAPTIYMMQVYDRVVPTGGLATLLWITLIVGLSLGVLSILDLIRSRVMMRASLRLERRLAEPILNHLLARRRTGGKTMSTAQAMREFDALRNALGGQPALVLFDIPWTPVYLAVAFLIHPLLALMIAVGGGALVLVTVINEKSTRTLQLQATVAAAQSYSRQERTAGKAEIIRALGMRRAMVARQVKDRSHGLVLGTRAQVAGSRYMAGAKFLRLFLQSCALGLAAALAIERQISVGSIIAGSVLLSRGLQPIEQLVSSLPAINVARQAVNTLTRLFEDDSINVGPRMSLPTPTGAILANGLGVRGDDGGPNLLLRDVTFSIAAGETIGVIGASGAGKTTLARVLSGGREPDAGAVRLDGAKMSDWDAEMLAPHIGYLPQDTTMLPGTVAENISRFAVSAGESRATVDADVIEAARLAGIHELILSLPGGYERVLDVEGGSLSAGQRQRVALARALFRDPAILIFDEPNSALDADGEAALAGAVRAARTRGATIIIIAHRSGILAFADRLLLLGNGTVEAFGPRDEVIAAINRKAKTTTAVSAKGPGR